MTLSSMAQIMPLFKFNVIINAIIDKINIINEIPAPMGNLKLNAKTALHEKMADKIEI